MRQRPRALLLGGLGLAALCLSACGGGSGLLTADQAASLNAQLDSVSGAVGAGQCGTATSAGGGLVDAIGNLGSVNSRLTDDLQSAASTVSAIAAHQCTSSTTTTTTTSSTASTTTSSPTTTTTTTSSTSSSVAPPPPSTVTSSSATHRPPGGGGGGGTPGPSGGAGIGNGNGNGQ